MPEDFVAKIDKGILSWRLNKSTLLKADICGNGERGSFRRAYELSSSTKTFPNYMRVSSQPNQICSHMVTQHALFLQCSPVLHLYN